MYLLNSYDTYSDSELFEQISADNKTAFTEIFKRYSDKLYSYALKIVHSEFWAEEIVQILFMQLWEGRASLAEVKNPPSYLFRIAANRSVDMLRKNETDARLHYYIVSRERNMQNEVEQQFDYRKMEKLLQEAVNSLPEQRRRVYLLKTDGNLSYEQIADQLQISKHTVRNQIAAATQTVRNYLVENGALFLVLKLFLFY